jgi:hypothetical protein
MATELRSGDELYFAYGSNMLSGRLIKRGIETVKVGNATLPGHTLRFHKRSLRDSSGKADAARTNDPNALVHGVIFELSQGRLALLDKIEGSTGTNPGYSREAIAVRVADGSLITVWTYIAKSHAIDSVLKPYTWYHDLVRYGSEEHGFPEDYRKCIDSIPAVTDPDPNRDDKIEAEALVAEYLELRGRVSSKTTG